MGCAKFGGIYFIYNVFVVLFVPEFDPNADDSLVLGKLAPVLNGRGDGGKKNQKLNLEVQFLPISGRLGPPSKIQTAITSSILGVGGSSLDSRELLVRSFNCTPLVT